MNSDQVFTGTSIDDLTEFTKRFVDNAIKVQKLSAASVARTEFSGTTDAGNLSATDLPTASEDTLGICTSQSGPQEIPPEDDEQNEPYITYEEHYSDPVYDAERSGWRHS